MNSNANTVYDVLTLTFYSRYYGDIGYREFNNAKYVYDTVDDKYPACIIKVIICDRVVYECHCSDVKSITGKKLMSVQTSKLNEIESNIREEVEKFFCNPSSLRLGVMQGLLESYKEFSDLYIPVTKSDGCELRPSVDEEVAEICNRLPKSDMVPLGLIRWSLMQDTWLSSKEVNEIMKKLKYYNCHFPKVPSGVLTPWLVLALG